MVEEADVTKIGNNEDSCGLVQKENPHNYNLIFISVKLNVDSNLQVDTHAWVHLSLLSANLKLST